MARFVLLLIVFTAPLLAAPVPKEVKKKPTTDGVWEAVDEIRNATRSDKASHGVWTINGDQLSALCYPNVDSLRKAGGSTETIYTYKMRFPDANDPTAFDFVASPDSKDGPEKVYRGRMEFTGDTLKICYPTWVKRERPAACEPDKDLIYFNFKRVDPETLKAK